MFRLLPKRFPDEAAPARGRAAPGRKAERAMDPVALLIDIIARKIGVC